MLLGDLTSGDVPGRKSFSEGRFPRATWTNYHDAQVLFINRIGHVVTISYNAWSKWHANGETSGIPLTPRQHSANQDADVVAWAAIIKLDGYIQQVIGPM